MNMREVAYARALFIDQPLALLAPVSYHCMLWSALSYPLAITAFLEKGTNYADYLLSLLGPSPKIRQ